MNETDSRPQVNHHSSKFLDKPAGRFPERHRRQSQNRSLLQFPPAPATESKGFGSSILRRKVAKEPRGEEQDYAEDKIADVAELCIAPLIHSVLH
jgi:hypothetical protein